MKQVTVAINQEQASKVAEILGSAREDGFVESAVADRHILLTFGRHEYIINDEGRVVNVANV